MVETGTVVVREGDMLVIEFARPEACQHCGQCDGSKHAHRLRVPGQARVGDQVTVDMPDRRVAQASVLVYLVPLLLLLAGLLAAESLRPVLAPTMGADWFAALCAMAGLAVGMGVLLLVDRMLRGRAGWQPQVIAVIPAAISVLEGEKT